MLISLIFFSLKKTHKNLCLCHILRAKTEKESRLIDVVFFGAIGTENFTLNETKETEKKTEEKNAECECRLHV